MSENLDNFINDTRGHYCLTQCDLEQSGYCDSMGDALCRVDVDSYYLRRSDNGYSVKNDTYNCRPWVTMSSEDAELFEYLGEWIVTDLSDREFSVRFVDMVATADGCDVKLSIHEC